MRCSRPEPAGRVKGKSNITGGWLRWLIFALAGQQKHLMQAGIEAFVVAPDGAPRTGCALDLGGKADGPNVRARAFTLPCPRW